LDSSVKNMPWLPRLSLDDQIDYVQPLWDRIAARPEQVPVPDRHRKVIRQRMADHEVSPSEGRPWEEVRDEIQNKIKSPKSQGRGAMIW